MRNGNNSKVLLGSGVLLALTSSLCCIMPLLAIIGGASSAMAAFSWVAPLRPYLLGATALVLGFAFYRVYKPLAKDKCGCEEKKSVLQSKFFLWMIAVVAVLLSAFPYYANCFENYTSRQQVVVNDTSRVQQALLHIRGMSCEACEVHVNNALLKKKGVQQVNTFYAKGVSIVKFDSTQVSLQQLTSALETETGYKVIP